MEKWSKIDQDLYNVAVPPRYAYWTILIDNKPTAFRSRDEEELLPTLNQLRRKNSDVVMKWFARGRLWDTPAQAQWAGKNLEGSAERRGRGWRPGGEHKDPHARFEKPRKEKPAGAAQRVRPTDKKDFRPADSQRRSADSQRKDLPWRDKKPGGALGQHPPQRPEPTGGPAGRNKLGPAAARSGPAWHHKPLSGAAKGSTWPRKSHAAKDTPQWQHKPPPGAAKGGPQWRRKPLPDAAKGGRSERDPWRSHTERSWQRDGQVPGAAKGKTGHRGRDARAADNHHAPGAIQGRPGLKPPLSGVSRPAPTTRADEQPGRPPGAGNTPSADAGLERRPNVQESPAEQKGEKPHSEPE